MSVGFRYRIFWSIDILPTCSVVILCNTYDLLVILLYVHQWITKTFRYVILYTTYYRLNVWRSTWKQLTLPSTWPSTNVNFVIKDFHIKLAWTDTEWTIISSWGHISVDMAVSQVRSLVPKVFLEFMRVHMFVLWFLNDFKSKVLLSLFISLATLQDIL